jgi:hypothetical protein
MLRMRQSTLRLALPRSPPRSRCNLRTCPLSAQSTPSGENVSNLENTIDDMGNRPSLSIPHLSRITCSHMPLIGQEHALPARLFVLPGRDTLPPYPNVPLVPRSHV